MDKVVAVEKRIDKSFRYIRKYFQWTCQVINIDDIRNDCIDLARSAPNIHHLVLFSLIFVNDVVGFWSIDAIENNMEFIALISKELDRTYSEWVLDCFVFSPMVLLRTCWRQVIKFIRFSHRRMCLAWKHQLSLTKRERARWFSGAVALEFLNGSLPQTLFLDRKIKWSSQSRFAKRNLKAVTTYSYGLPRYLQWSGLTDSVNVLLDV